MMVNVWHDVKDDPGRLHRLRIDGVDASNVYSEEDLAKGNELVFAASGVTKGELLEGVTFTSQGASVHSLCVRFPSRTVERSTTLLRFKSHPVYETLF
jgi:fructose-1,6-bisphosphatase II